MKILVTGGNGFIGNNLIRQLEKNKNDEIHYCGRPTCRIALSRVNTHTYYHSLDLSVQSEVEQLFSEFKPDLIYHLAANPNPQLDKNNPSKIWQDNVVATQNLCHFCPDNCRVIYASSIVVYGDSKNDYDFREFSPLKPTSIYGATKVAGENIMDFYIKSGKINGVNVRLCATVGNGTRHGILKDFVTKAQDTSVKPLGEMCSFTILGDRPGSTKPYLYISDTVKALEWIANNKEVPQHLNLCPSNSISCEDIAKIVLEQYYDNWEIVRPLKFLGSGANWKGDNPFIYASNALLRHYGFQLEYPTSQDAILAGVKSYV